MNNLKLINTQELTLFTFINNVKNHIEKYKNYCASIDTFLNKLSYYDTQYRINSNFDCFYNCFEDIILELVEDINQEAINNNQFIEEINQKYQGSYDLYLNEDYEIFINAAEIAETEFKKLKIN
jgi:hypothetical protein